MGYLPVNFMDQALTFQDALNHINNNKRIIKVEYKFKKYFYTYRKNITAYIKSLEESRESLKCLLNDNSVLILDYRDRSIYINLHQGNTYKINAISIE